MGRASFEAYGKLANSSLSLTQQAGRYPVQAEAERLIAPDVAAKLELLPSDTLVDIGCGPGTILRALAPTVASATGIDHPDTINQLRPRVAGTNVALLAGNFLDLKVDVRATKVVAYSVIQYTASPEEARRFVDKALALLEPGGRLLVGDLPNVDLRRRFQGSEEGRRFDIEWKRLAKGGDAGPVLDDSEQFVVDDAFVAGLLLHCRSKGFDAWLVRQAPDLPFGNTREDLLVRRPA
jgi:SAM-dependent methyltransferase